MGRTTRKSGREVAQHHPPVYRPCSAKGRPLKSSKLTPFQQRLLGARLQKKYDILREGTIAPDPEDVPEGSYVYDHALATHKDKKRILMKYLRNFPPEWVLVSKLNKDVLEPYYEVGEITYKEYCIYLKVRDVQRRARSLRTGIPCDSDVSDMDSDDVASDSD
jgi:hypothetical protein